MPSLKDSAAIGNPIDEGVPEFLVESTKQPDKVAQDYFQGLASELAGQRYEYRQNESLLQ